MELELDISDERNHKVLAAKLVEFAGNERVFLFDAPMGAGKTTFIKAICQHLNVTDTMSSPTYSIVNEYNTTSGMRIYHFDLYRLKDAEELYDLGFDDYVNSGNYVFIEWPEMAMPFLTSYLRIIIRRDRDNRYLCAQIFK